MTYKSSKALASHRARSHHKERLSGRYVKDGNCPFCGAFFHTRRRAPHHVDFGSKNCKTRLLSSPGLPELNRRGNCPGAPARQARVMRLPKRKVSGAMQAHQLAGQGQSNNWSKLHLMLVMLTARLPLHLHSDGLRNQISLANMVEAHGNNADTLECLQQTAASVTKFPARCFSLIS